MKKCLFVLLAMFSLSALAERPQVTGTITMLPPFNPAFGDTANFDAQWSGKPGPHDDIYVYVKCVQHNVKVYGESRWGPYEFVLVSPTGRWDSSQPADCQARLEMHEQIAQEVKIRVLDYIEFVVDP